MALRVPDYGLAISNDHETLAEPRLASLGKTPGDPTAGQPGKKASLPSSAELAQNCAWAEKLALPLVPGGERLSLRVTPTGVSI